MAETVIQLYRTWRELPEGGWEKAEILTKLLRALSVETGMVVSVEVQSELGATGEFPQGRMSEDDEGELRMALAVQGARR